MTDFAALLRELMCERGLSGRGLARLVPCDAALVSRLASGKQRPSVQMVAKLDLVLSAGGALVEAARPGRAASLRSGRHQWDESGDGEMRRRELLGAIVAGPLAFQLEQVRRHLDGVPAAVSERDADQWEQVAARYALVTAVTPVSGYLPHLLADAAEVTDRVMSASGSVRVRLTRSAARIAALTALGLSSLGDQLTSERWWRTSVRVADESADGQLVALIVGRHAVNAGFWPGGDPLALADRALAAADGTECAGVVFAHQARAEALAGMGRRVEALAAMATHQDAWERLPDQEQGTGSDLGHPERRVWSTRAVVLARVGGPGEAMTAIDACLKRPASAGVQAGTELLRAESLIRAGDVENGARHSVRVLSGLPAAWRGEHEVVSKARRTLAAVPVSHATRRPVREAHEVLAMAAGGR